MFSHIMTSVTDFERTFAFYTGVLAELRLEMRFHDPGGRCEGEPGLRPEYHANYDGAYFRDTEGNKICVASHGTE